MSSNASRTSFLRVLAAFVLLFSTYLVSKAQNSCECGEPSRGTVTCERDQEPFCIVRSGKVDARCKTSGGRSGSTLQRYLIEQAVGRPLTEVEWSNPELQKSLETGKVQLKNWDGKTVSVTLRPTSEFQENRIRDFEPPPASSKSNSSAASAGGPSKPAPTPERACEVCVEVNGVSHCKSIGSEDPEETQSAVTALCDSNAVCLKQKPKVKCKP